MKDSLYQYYSQNPLNLYEVRRHFLWHFYCQNHSRNDARKVLRVVVTSSRIGRIIEKSIQKKHAPNYSDFLSTIKGMLRFWFCSKETLVLATIEANDVLSAEAVHTSSSSVDLEYMKPSSDDKSSEDTSESEDSTSLQTWTLDEFINEFGPKMQVKEFANSKTGDLFKSCVFTKGKTRTFVAFSSKLGEHTKKELLDMKDELIILKVQNGKYKLAKHYYT